MGMMKWMARKGAVGGTARWAAQGYQSFIKQDPNIKSVDLYKILIQYRYAAIPNPEQEAFLLSLADQIRGLRGLVVSILTIEAGFTENAQNVQHMFIEVIEEELIKCRVPQNVIFPI